jgi:hypothetical protein
VFLKLGQGGLAQGADRAPAQRGQPGAPTGEIGGA